MTFDEQLKAAGLTRAEYDRRNEIWKIFMARLPEDEAEKIRADPRGGEALALMITVELAIQGARN